MAWVKMGVQFPPGPFKKKFKKNNYMFYSYKTPELKKKKIEIEKKYPLLKIVHLAENPIIITFYALAGILVIIIILAILGAAGTILALGWLLEIDLILLIFSIVIGVGANIISCFKYSAYYKFEIPSEFYYPLPLEK